MTQFQQTGCKQPNFLACPSNKSEFFSTTSVLACRGYWNLCIPDHFHALRVLGQVTLTGFTRNTHHPVNLVPSQLCTLGPIVCLGQQFPPDFAYLQHIDFLGWKKWCSAAVTQQRVLLCQQVNQQRVSLSFRLSISPWALADPCVILFLHIIHSLQLRIGPERRNCCSSSVTFLL